LRETGVRCIRCDRPICPDCMRPASVGFQCPDDVKLARDAQRSQRTVVGARARQSYPYVTWSIVTLNVLAYLATALPAVHGVNHPETTSLFRSWALQPIAVASDHKYYELVTSAFVHIGLLHIFMNMFALVMVGPFLERVLGTWRFGALYLISALGGSVAVYLFGSQYALVAGASGAIYGLFGACLVLVRKLQLNMQWLVGTIVINFVFTFSVPGISKYGHIGGFIAGAIAAVAIAGLPNDQRRVPPRTQVMGLAGMFVLAVVAVIWRTAAI
jgi:membrane associated rhomboid family serine protease